MLSRWACSNGSERTFVYTRGFYFSGVLFWGRSSNFVGAIIFSGRVFRPKAIGYGGRVCENIMRMLLPAGLIFVSAEFHSREFGWCFVFAVVSVVVVG